MKTKRQTTQQTNTQTYIISEEMAKTLQNTDPWSNVISSNPIEDLKDMVKLTNKHGFRWEPPFIDESKRMEKLINKYNYDKLMVEVINKIHTVKASGVFTVSYIARNTNYLQHPKKYDRNWYTKVAKRVKILLQEGYILKIGKEYVKA